MAIEVTAVLAGTSTPQQVQVEVSGLTLGDIVTVRGHSGAHSWVVRGGQSVPALGSSLVRRDNMAPVNAPITYRATVAGVQYASEPVTVPYSSDYVLSSLDGTVRVDMEWGANGDPIQMNSNLHLSYPNGRMTPVARYAPAGGESGAWRLLTQSPADTRVLRDLLRAGGPLLMRTSGEMLDFLPARIVVFANSVRELFGVEGARIWELPWVEVADPQAGRAVTAWTLDDLNRAWAALSTAEGSVHEYDWDVLNAFIASTGDGTFDDVNRFAWDEAAVAP